MENNLVKGYLFLKYSKASKYNKLVKWSKIVLFSFCVIPSLFIPMLERYTMQVWRKRWLVLEFPHCNTNGSCTLLAQIYSSHHHENKGPPAFSIPVIDVQNLHRIQSRWDKGGNTQWLMCDLLRISVIQVPALQFFGGGSDRGPDSSRRVGIRDTKLDAADQGQNVDGRNSSSWRFG